MNNLIQVKPQDFTEFYPEYLWEKYGAIRGRVFYRVPDGRIYFWALALGAEDMHREWLDKNEPIITDNEKWAKDLKSAGYKVMIQRLVEV